MYQRTTWKDHVVQFPRRFTETPNGDGTVEHVPSPGSTLQLGTNMDAEHFNNLEVGIALLTAAFELSQALSQATIRNLEERLALAEVKLATLP